MDHIGERVPIQDSMKIRLKPQSGGDLSQSSEKDFSARQLRAWGEVLRVARIADDCFGCNAAQPKRGGSQARRADHDVGRKRKLIETGCDFNLGSIRLQLGRKCAQPLRVARA